MAPGFDPQAAQQALDLDRRISGMQIAIQTPASSQEAVACRALLGDFGRASIYGEIRPRARADFWRDLYGSRAPVASLLAWRAPTDDAIEGIAEWMLNRSLDDRWGGNLGGLRSPGLDSLLLRALREPTPEGRQALRTEIEIRLADDLPYVPLARVRELAYTRSTVTGLGFDRYYGLDLGRAKVQR
jgi:ABC-type transport system substrate-binding protein